MPYLAPLLRYSDLLAKNRKFCPPLLFSALVQGNPIRNYGKALRILKPDVFQAADSENLVILACNAFD